MTIKDEICPTVKVDARLLDDGTLWIKTDKIADIGRVIVEDGKTSCKQFYQDAQPEPCEDAVSREEVLNCLEWQYPDKLPRTKIMELPPVTPKQRTGKWIKITNTLYKCDQCGAVQLKGNYCKDCGAKMEGVNNA